MNPAQEPYDPGVPYAWVEPQPAPPRRPLHRTLAASGLTIVALAIRQAEHLLEEMRQGSV